MVYKINDYLLSLRWQQHPAQITISLIHRLMSEKQKTPGYLTLNTLAGSIKNANISQKLPSYPIRGHCHEMMNTLPLVKSLASNEKNSFILHNPGK